MGKAFKGPVSGYTMLIIAMYIALAVGAANAGFSHNVSAAGRDWAAHSQAWIVQQSAGQLRLHPGGGLPFRPRMASAIDGVRRAAVVQAAALQKATPAILNALTPVTFLDRCV